MTSIFFDLVDFIPEPREVFAASIQNSDTLRIWHIFAVNQMNALCGLPLECLHIEFKRTMSGTQFNRQHRLTTVFGKTVVFPTYYRNALGLLVNEQPPVALSCGHVSDVENEARI